MLTNQRTLVQLEIDKAVIQANKLIARAKRYERQGALDKAIELLTKAQSLMDTAEQPA